MIKFAGFRYRVLASLLDGAILFSPHLLFWLYISTSQNLSQLVNNTLFYFIIWLLPSMVVGFLYSAYFTSVLGGTIGKLLTGLRVSDETHKLLTFRKSLFRHTIGYTFAWTLFGLGYWSIIKDSRKQGWHDKAIGSLVKVTKPLWPMGLLALIVLWVIQTYLVVSTVNNFSAGPIKNQIDQIIRDYKSAPASSPNPSVNSGQSPTVSPTNPNKLRRRA